MDGHLEIFSCSQVIESSREYLLLRTDILQKTVVGCPCVKLFRLVGSSWYSRIFLPPCKMPIKRPDTLLKRAGKVLPCLSEFTLYNTDNSLERRSRVGPFLSIILKSCLSLRRTYLKDSVGTKGVHLKESCPL